jgi:hypothetical protein
MSRICQVPLATGPYPDTKEPIARVDPGEGRPMDHQVAAPLDTVEAEDGRLHL